MGVATNGLSRMKYGIPGRKALALQPGIFFAPGMFLCFEDQLRIKGRK
jgi:hypothetical protein